MDSIKSLFNTYIEGSPNSFDANLKPFNHNEPLYQHIVLVNSNVQTIIDIDAVFASENGFFLKNDRIIPNLDDTNFVDEYCTTKLRLIGWNRYYYTYKENKYGIQYAIYTQKGFVKLRQYIYEATDVVGDEVFDEDIVGAMTIYFHSFLDKKDDACVTILLSKNPIPNKNAINIEEPSWAPDALSFSSLRHLFTRGFALSLIHDFLKHTGYLKANNQKIDFNLLGGWESYIERNAEKLGAGILNTDKAKVKNKYDDIVYNVRTKREEAQKLEKYLRNCYESFSDDIKDICRYFLPNEYKYTSISKELASRFRDDKLIAFTNIMMFNHKTGITDELIPFTYTKEDLKEIGKLADSLTRDMLGIKNKILWLDSNGLLAIEYIVGLIVYLSDIKAEKNFQLKSIFAVWAYYMLYKNVQNSHEADRFFLYTLIFYVLGTNGKTFSKFMDKIKDKEVIVSKSNWGEKTSSWWQLDSELCIGELICYFSNSFKTFSDRLSEEQKRFLGNGCTHNVNYLKEYSSLVSFSVAHSYLNIDIMRKEYAKKLFDYINEMLHCSDYTNKDILNVIMDDFSFNLDNIVSYDIKEKYLPVRAMTADNMRFIGDVAIIACNPIKYRSLGSMTTSEFDISENDDTEYFVFSKYCPLYNDLVNRTLGMDSWKPNPYAYFTIKGWIHGVERIVHIDSSLYYE